MTKTFENMAAQGDMILRKIESLPIDAVETKPKNGEYVVAHSETGHNHAIKADDNVQFYEHANDNLIAYLVVNNDKALLEHHRAYKQHEAIEIPIGIYEIRRQREEDVFGSIRRALD